MVEWERVKALASQPKTPAQGMSAMTALGASPDLALADRTFTYLMAEARDQDVLFLLRGLQQNSATRRFLAEKTKEHFVELERRYAGTFNLTRWIEVSASRP